MSDTDTKRNFLTAHDYRGAKWVAAAAGLLGTLLALVMAFLPVERTTAKIVWPENNTVSSVVAPLVSYVATDMHVAVPCSAATALGEKGGPESNRPFVGGEAGAVKRRAFASVAVPRAQHKIAAGRPLSEIGEVVDSHARLRQTNEGVPTQEVRNRAPHQACHLRIVYERRIPLGKAHLPHHPQNVRNIHHRSADLRP